jgi:type II secretory pathway component PulC
MPQQLQNWLPLLLKLLLWFCMAGIAYTLANTALVLISDPRASASDSTRTVAQEKNSDLPPAPLLEQMIQRQFFGRYAQEGEQRRNTGMPATPTRLPLTLEAVFISSNGDDSSAIISERRKPGKLYAINDLVPGNARLIDIETERVILQRGGTREALAFKSDFKAAVGANADSSTEANAAQLNRSEDPLTSERAEPLRNAVQELLAVAAGDNGEALTAPLADIRVPTNDVLTEELAAQPSQTLEKLGIKAHTSGMYELSDQANPLLLQAGLQAGDVVISINGRSLDELMANRQSFNTLAAAGRVNIEVLRQGRPLKITSRVPESLRQ